MLCLQGDKHQQQASEIIASLVFERNFVYSGQVLVIWKVDN